MSINWPTTTVAGHPYGTLDANECKQQFSLAYAGAILAAARCGWSDVKSDFETVDFTVRQVADHMTYSGSRIDVQMKCTAQEVLHADGIHWKLSVADYDSLRDPRRIAPVILVVLRVPENPLDWLAHSPTEILLRHAAHWMTLRNLPALPSGQESKTVILPRGNEFNVDQLLAILSRVGSGGTP